jgi:hypothetical protein
MGKLYTKEKLEWFIQSKNWKDVYQGTKERKINGKGI